MNKNSQRLRKGVYHDIFLSRRFKSSKAFSLQLKHKTSEHFHWVCENLTGRSGHGWNECASRSVTESHLCLSSNLV